MKHLLSILVSAKQLWPYYGAVSIFTVLVSIVNLVQPLLAGWAINELQEGSGASLRYVSIIAGLIFISDVLATLFSNIGGYLGDQLALKLNRLLSRQYYEHLLSLPQSYFDSQLSGTIIGRLNRSINEITDFIQVMSNMFLQFIVTTVLTLAIVAYYSWEVALMMLLIYPIYILMTARTSTKWQAWQAEINKQFDVANGRFAEVINQIKVVKSFLRERAEVVYFDRHYKRALAVNRPQSKYWHKHDVYRRLMLGIIFFGIYLYIFMQGVRGELSTGAVVTLILYGMQIRTPIFTISFLVDRAQRAAADSKDYSEVMAIKPAITDKKEAARLKVDQGEVIFNNVHFGYSQDKEVLRGVNFHVVPRTKVALVGESGEGKTTITNLLLRLYEPSTGIISIDGQDVMNVTQQSLRSQIGVVFQEPALFSGSVRENIAYGSPGASEEEIRAAAASANADEFINKLDKGYDTSIGERGVRLSGGQKQRIAIARALLKDAPILILDEATSSLDSRSEQLVQEALERLMKNRTTIIIAHRLSTVQHVDQVITIHNGKVDESGPPHELAVSGGIYSRLLALQQRTPGVKRDKALKAFDISAT